jgi:hypothetical protein
MKALTKTQARQALIEGKKVRNIHYSDNEYLFLNKNGDLETEDGYTYGGFLSEFWNDIQSKLPDEWYVVEEKSTRELSLEWWNQIAKKYGKPNSKGNGYQGKLYPLNQKQFKEFNSELFKAYIDKFSDEDKLKAFLIMNEQFAHYSHEQMEIVRKSYDEQIKFLQNKILELSK